MGTRSQIGFLEEKTGKVVSSYCHWDGYYEGVGATLVSFYTGPIKAKKIASLGFISSLKDSLSATLQDAQHNEKPIVHDGLDEYFDSLQSGQEYCYVFMNGEWYGRDCSKWSAPLGACGLPLDWRPVREYLASEEE